MSADLRGLHVGSRRRQLAAPGLLGWASVTPGAPPPPPPPPPPGGDTLIGYVTIENAEAVDKTDEIFETGFPTAPTHVATGQVLKIKDDDGSGGIGSTLALAQVDLVHTDNNSKQRNAKITAIIPNLGSSAGGSKRRRLAVYSSPDALPTGTAITIADVQALVGYSNGLFDVRCDINGTIWSGSVKDILDAAVTTYTKTALWTCAQLIRSGPTCSEWRLRMPLRNGGSAHNSGNGLHVEFHFSAHKAGSAAVSGGNPITAVRCDYEIQNADLTRALADTQHYYYGLEARRATSLSDATMISTDQTCYPYGAQRHNYPRSQPAATVTLSGGSLFALHYDAQTANFTVLQTITGATSGATARVIGGTDNGTTGFLQLDTISGTFQDNETITDPLGGSATTDGQVVGYGNAVTLTRSTGVWDAGIVGAHIVGPSGVGRASVATRTSDTVLVVYVYEKFKYLAHTSSNWTIEGIGHHYNIPVIRRAWIGNRPTHVTALGDHTSAVTPTTNRVMKFLADAEVIFESALAFSDVSHTDGITSLNLMRGDAGTIRPLTLRGDVQTSLGELQPSYPASGPRPQIGPQPAYYVAGLVKYDADGRRRIFEGAEYVATNSYYMPPRLSGSPAAGDLTLPPRADQGGTSYYRWHNGTVQSWDINRPASTSFWPVDQDPTHHPAGPYVPWLLTGDYRWLSAQMRSEAYYAWAKLSENVGTIPTGYGDGTVATRGPMGATNSNSIFGTIHTRGMAWTLREMVMMTASVPDASKSSLWHAKSYYTGRLAERSAAANYWKDHARLISPTTGPVWDFRQGGDNNYITEDPSLNIELLTPWTFAFLASTISKIWYLGLNDADWDEYIDWMLRHFTESYTDPNVVWESYSTTFQHVAKMNDGVNCISNSATGDPTNIADMYHRTCMTGPSNTKGWGLTRAPTGTLTLSASTVGTGRTFTFSNSYFASGGTGSSAWYAGNGAAWKGGYIRRFSGSSTIGLAKITSVTSATVVVADIIVDFGTTTPTISQIQIPGAHPSDYAGENANAGLAEACHLACALKALQKPRPGATDAVIAALAARPGFSPTTIEPQFHIVART